MRKIALVACSLSLAFSSGCDPGLDSDPGRALMTAFEAAKAGDFTAWAEMLKDEAYEEYGNRAAMEKAGARLRRVREIHLSDWSVSTRGWGDRARPPGALVEYRWKITATLTGPRFTTYENATVECVYLEKQIGSAIGQEPLLVHCKITRLSGDAL